MKYLPDNGQGHFIIEKMKGKSQSPAHFAMGPLTLVLGDRPQRKSARQVVRRYIIHGEAAHLLSQGVESRYLK